MVKANENEGERLLARWQELAAAGEARKVRIKAGISAREVARRLGLSWSAVHYWEANGQQHRRPRGRKGLAYATFMEQLANEVEA